MGACSDKLNDGKDRVVGKEPENKEVVVAISKMCFQYLHVIGKGGFGRVWKVEKKKERKLYAMKEMSKARILAKRSVNSVLNERKILSQLRHPYLFCIIFCSFIVNMAFSFQDKENLYLVMDLMDGGDLRYHITRRKRFGEAETSIRYMRNMV